MKKALILLSIIAVSFYCAEKRTNRGPSYNLLIIVSDALRADALSCYGGEADTPNIDRLATQGVLFENAYSNSSWTVPSSISMFTGDYPGAFGQLVNEEPESDGIRPYFMVIIYV